MRMEMSDKKQDATFGESYAAILAEMNLELVA